MKYVKPFKGPKIKDEFVNQTYFIKDFSFIHKKSFSKNEKIEFSRHIV